MNHFTVTFYSKENGECPVETFLDSLGPKLRAKAFRDLEVLREKALALREPLVKHLGEGLFELRIQQGGDAARIFYFFFGSREIVVTSGYLKKTRKAPRKRIKEASGFKQDWERRHANG